MDSMVTRNCSIINGGTTLGKTWEQVSNMLNTKDGLVLKTLNSSTRIYLTRLEATYRSPSPSTFHRKQTRKLSCVFKGWPIPRVFWYKDGKAVVNGTNGFYHTEIMSEDHHNTLEGSLYIPSREENEGFYTCTAKSSICDFSSNPKSQEIQVIYKCPPGIDAKDSKIAAIAFSNSTLSCLVYDRHDDCDLTWFFNNKTLPSKSNDKYKIALQEETSSKCKKAFSLMVMNVTFVDKGTYSCMCEYHTFQWSAPVKLNVYHATPVTLSPKKSFPETTFVQEQAGSMPGGSSRKWIFPVISISACGVFALITAVVVRYVKKELVYKKIEHVGRAEEGVTNNKLFISYSSKDYSWVTENLLAFLDKHSIPYSIHTRDFELGKPIVQNMADSVYNSRQVLIVLSDNYLASNFCREELHMAVQRGVDTGDSSLVLVLIDKFNKKRLPCALRNKALLNFEKHKRKQNWEEKLLRAIIGAKTVSSV